MKDLDIPLGELQISFMEAAPTYRWALGSIAMRWRHAFWLLPLAGLLIGLGLQLWEFYGPTATGTIIVAVSPTSSPAEVPSLLRSDELLFKATDSLNLSKRWSISSGTCVVKLRDMIRSEVISGTSLVEVYVSNSSRRESIEIWSTLSQLANQHFLKRRAAETAKLPIRMGCILYSDPVIAHETPTLFSLDRPGDLISLLRQTVIALSIGVTLAAPFAYLLELLLPRRCLNSAFSTSFAANDSPGM